MTNFNYYALFLLVLSLVVPATGTAAVTASPASATFLSFPNWESNASNAQPTGLPTLQEDFTVEADIFLPYWPPSSYFYIVLKEGFCQLSLTRYTDQYSNDYFEFYFGVATGTAGEFEGIGFGTDDWDMDDNWHHLVATYTAGTGDLHLYLDGSEAVVGSNWDIAYTFNSTVTHTTPILSLFVGDEDDIYLDELRISQGLRYTENFTPPTTPFDLDANTAGLWHFDEEPGTSIFLDSSVNGNNLTAENGTTTVRQRILTLYKRGSGKGTIRSTPSGNYCNTSCTNDTGSYSESAAVTLTAEPEAGSIFKGWSGACMGKGDCNVTMTTDLTVYADFTKPPLTPLYQLLLKDDQ